MANNGKGLEKFGLLVSFFCIFTAAQLNMNDSVPFVLFYTRPNVCVCAPRGKSLRSDSISHGNSSKHGSSSNNSQNNSVCFVGHSPEIDP